MPAESPAIDPRRRGLKSILILDSLVTLVLAPLALFWGMMSAMATTTTTNMAFANAYVLVNLTLPLAMVVCLIAGWVAWSRRAYRWVWPLLLAPLAWLVVSVAMMAAWPQN